MIRATPPSRPSEPPYSSTRSGKKFVSMATYGPKMHSPSSSVSKCCRCQASYRPPDRGRVTSLSSRVGRRQYGRFCSIRPRKRRARPDGVARGLVDERIRRIRHSTVGGCTAKSVVSKCALRDPPEDIEIACKGCGHRTYSMRPTECHLSTVECNLRGGLKTLICKKLRIGQIGGRDHIDS